MARDKKGITQFYLPPTHEPYLPLLPSLRASPPFGWYLLRLPKKGWPGWVDLGVWLYTEIDFRHRELNLGPVTHPSTNWVRSRVTSLIKTNVLPLRQTTNQQWTSSGLFVKRSVVVVLFLGELGCHEYELYGLSSSVSVARSSLSC